MCACCALGEVAFTFYNRSLSIFPLFRHITDATLAIVKGETVPLDVLQIKVNSFLQILKKILKVAFKRYQSNKHMLKKTDCSSVHGL
jgi:hypothetical protein